MLKRSRCAAHWRPFLAPSMVRREASAWGSVSGPLLPSSHARFGMLCRIQPPAPGFFDVACRRSSVPVTTSRSVNRTLPCHLAESSNFSPSPSPAIAVSATFRSLARLMDARAGSELASAPSPLGVLSAVNVYPQRSTLGACVLFCVRVPVGYWGTPMGPTPAPRPRRAQRWHDRAGLCGVQRQSPNRPIARRIRRRRERPDPRDRVRRFRFRRIGGVRRPSPRRRLPCRRTPLYLAAVNGHSESVAELLLHGADGAVQETNFGYRCAAPHSRTENRSSRARAGGRRSNTRGCLGSSRTTRRPRARCTPPAASQLPPTPLASHPLPPLLVPTDVPSVLAVCARRSSGQGGPHSTRIVTDTLAARLVVHHCTRGSECSSHLARAAALIGSAKCARERRAVPRTARGDRLAAHANARNIATQ
jgi:hypothetical protein